MSNAQPGGQFDFGGGMGSAPTSMAGAPPQLPHPAQLPPQQLPPGAPPNQPPGAPVAPVAPVAPATGGTRSGNHTGGIVAAGVIALVVMLILVGVVGWTGNRIRPLSADTDSAWAPLGGRAGELTSALRGAGFTCSDEGVAVPDHRHRVCARYTDTSKVSIEFSGDSAGTVERMVFNPTQRGADRDAWTLAVGKALPELTADQYYPAAGATASGSWGIAHADDAGTITLQSGANTPAQTEGSMVHGNVADVRARAERRNFSCSDAGPGTVSCTSNNAQQPWTLNLQQSTNDQGLARIQLVGTFPRDGLDNAAPVELLTYLVGDDSMSQNRIKWFLETSNNSAGQAGFVNGFIVSKKVTKAPNDGPTTFDVDVHTSCRAYDPASPVTAC
ncbi:hypothetical protein [Granulicoccus phenolivorans]|uniref:hypothetical protein n=1 Tax=Granulicoccus phenolivorans TaxID=266854 RepID=UPI0011AE7E8A|nr:hypothetical protein [Granulicoccus phenolivorans]